MRTTTKSGIRILCLLVIAAIVVCIPTAGKVLGTVSYGASSLGYSVAIPVKLEDGQPAPDGIWFDILRVNGAYDDYIGRESTSNGSVAFDAQSGVDYYLRYSHNNTSEYSQYNGKDAGQLFSVPLVGSAPEIVLKRNTVIETTVTLGGKPVSGAEVELCQVDADGYEYYFGHSEITDSSGRVSFGYYPSASDGRQYFFYVNKGNGFAEYHGADKGKTFSLPGQIPTVELDAGHNITAIVTIDGVPREDIELSLYFSDWLSRPLETGLSGPDGKVTFLGLTPGLDYFFYVPQSNQNIEYYGKYFIPQPGAVYTIALDSGETCSTTVTYQGQPVVGQEVELRSNRASQGSLFATTDNNGTAAFGGLLDGQYYFIVRAPSHQPYADYDGRLANQQFRLPGTAPNIELETGNTVSVNVSMEDGTIPDSATVKINYIDAAGRVVYSQTKNFSGQFNDKKLTFNNLPSGQRCYFTVEQKVGQNAPYNGRALGNVFSVPGTAPDIVLEVGQSGTTTVTLDGVPQNDIRVIMQGGNSNFYAWTDKNGVASFFNIPTTAGGQYFSVYGEVGKFAHYDGSNLGKYFSSADSEYPAIELERGFSTDVTIRYQGRPVNNAFALLCQINAAGEDIYVADATTDPNGVVHFTNVVAGNNYYFMVFPDDDAFPEYNGLELNQFYSLPGNIVIDISGTGTGTGGGWSSSSRSGSGGGTGTRYVPNPLAPAPITGPVNTVDAVRLTKQAVREAREAGAELATVKLRNVGELSPETAQAMVKAAGGMAIEIQADSTLNNGAVDVRITCDPAKLTKTVNLSASTVSVGAQTVQNTFEKHFQNRIQVISFAQQGEFGIPATLAAKTDVPWDADQRYFYRYNKEKNSYKQMDMANFRIDSKGYIHFTTESAGEIVISDQPLKKN